jgi:hypothetical protein
VHEHDKLVLGYKGKDYERLTTTPHLFKQLHLAIGVAMGESKKPILQRIPTDISADEQPAQLYLGAGTYYVYRSESGVVMKVGFIGLGRMGSQMVARLLDQSQQVVAYDVEPEAVQRVIRLGATPAKSREEMGRMLGDRPVVWLMIPARYVDEEMAELLRLCPRLDYRRWRQL